MDNIFLNACKNAQKGVVQAFLKKGGINIDKRDGLGNTPLYYVSLKGSKDIAQILIEADADVSLANNNSETPLHCVAKKGNKDIIRMLLERGANINATDKNGETPLIYAIRSGKTETALYLLSLGADASIKSNEGYSSLDYATAKGMRDLVGVLAGDEADTKDAQGNTPLHQAVYNNQSETVAALLKTNKNNINQLNDDGMSALILAISNSNIGIVEMLIKEGADINAADNRGKSALAYASELGLTEIVEQLIIAGAENLHSAKLCKMLVLSNSSPYST